MYKNLGLVVLFLLAPLACRDNRDAASAPPLEDQIFERRWSQTTAKISALKVSATPPIKGAELGGTATAVVKAIVKTKETPLELAEVNDHVRDNMRGLNACYRQATHRHPELSGKAILAFAVAPTGQVQKVDVLAPRFRGTGLDRCLIKHVKSWEFRTFKGDPLEVDYPLVFLGSGS